MNLFKKKSDITLKKTDIPVDEITTVDGVQVWSVRWKSRNSDGYASYGSVREEVEVFLCEENAKNFKVALQNAFGLLRYSFGTEVNIKKEL
jgi:hypothetical protein